MTEFPVQYKLYQSNGTTPVYTFTYVQTDNSPQDPMDYVELSSLRGIGSVIIGGSTQAWDLRLGFILLAADYAALISAMDSLETTIVKNTPYVLKIHRTAGGGTTKSYNVKRLLPFEFVPDFRTDYQAVVATFRVNTW